jgi:acetyl esterase
MASAICMMARDRKGMMPLYEVLVYPVADSNVNTPSYLANAKAKPLNKSMMQWFFRYTVKSAVDGKNLYLAILKGNVTHLPPATVITDEIDPLMSEGQAMPPNSKGRVFRFSIATTPE